MWFKETSLAQEWKNEELGMQKIQEAMADSETPVWRICCMIGQQMWALHLMMLRAWFSPLQDFRSMKRVVPIAIRNLRMVKQTLLDAERSRRCSQRLDISSPQFQAAYDYLLKLFYKALHGAGLNADLAHNILLQFRDLVTSGETELKRAIADAAMN